MLFSKIISQKPHAILYSFIACLSVQYTRIARFNKIEIVLFTRQNISTILGKIASIDFSNHTIREFFPRLHDFLQTYFSFESKGKNLHGEFEFGDASPVKV